MLKVDGLGHSVVGELLERGLHLGVIKRAYVVRADKYTADVGRNFLDMLQRAFGGDLFHQPVAVQAARLQDLLEHGVDFDHFGAVHNVADKDIGEYRFDTRGAAGDDGKRAGRRNRGDGRVAKRRSARIDTLFKQWKRAAHFGKLG